MTLRKAISKKLRFEVFKRDSFKCQYCGKCAPDVVLNVDHINPVSKGGKNDIMNLITSCEDCNSGKSDNLLSDDSVVAKQRAQLEELNERREQLTQMLKWRDGLASIKEDELTVAAKEWHGIITGYTLNEKGLKTLKKMIKDFGLSNVLDAMPTAEKYLIKEGSRFTEDSVSIAFRKLGGILKLNAEPEWRRSLFYIRGILRNQVSYVDEVRAMRMLEDAYEADVSIEDLKYIAKRSGNWTNWCAEMYRVMGIK